MPVDRPYREKVIAKFLEFVRREIGSEAFHESLMGDDFLDTDDSAACEAQTMLMGYASDVKDREFRTNREGWDFVTRVLAFLRTDYHLHPQRTDNWRVMSWWPRWLLLGLLAAAGVSWWLWNGWILLGVWVATYGVWRVSFPIDKRAGQRLLAEWPFFPLLSAGDWQQHQFLVKSLALPEYDPDVYDHPIHSRAEERRLMFYAEAGNLLFLPIALLTDAVPSEREIYLRSEDTPPPRKPTDS